MPVITRKRFARRGFVWVPKKYQNLNWKVEINSIDVTSDLFGCKFSLAVTDEIGQCNILLNNNAGSYDFSGGQTIEIYVDYGSATTLKWKGEIEKIEPAFQSQGRTYKIVGRHVSSQLMDITVTASYSNTAIEDILEDIVDDYATGFTYSKTTYPASAVATVNWENKPFWECVIDLCNLAQYDCYVDNSNAFIFFSRGSRTNGDEAIVHDNALDIKGLGTDTVKVRNKIIVNGRDADGTSIVYTAEDSDSQTNYNVKEKVITDTSISTVADAKARAEAELELLKETETAGEVEALIMPDLNPGDKIWIMYPMLDIHDKYRVVKFETNLYSSPFKTKVWINSVKRIPDLFKDRMQKDLQTEEIQNPEQMDFSFNDTFDNENLISTKTNLEVKDGVLKITAGNNTGIMTSTTTQADNNITQAYIVVQGNALTGNEYWVSNTGGSKWESISPKTLHTFTSTGKVLRFRMRLNSSSTETDSYVVMYS